MYATLYTFVSVISPDIHIPFEITFIFPGTQSNSNGVNLGSNQKLFPVSSNNQQQQQQQQIQGNKQYGREGEGAGYSGGSNPQWQTYQQQQMPPAGTYQGPINQFQGANNHGYEGE
jgi:hypothetical protein